MCDLLNSIFYFAFSKQVWTLGLLSSTLTIHTETVHCLRQLPLSSLSCHLVIMSVSPCVASLIAEFFYNDDVCQQQAINFNPISAHYNTLLCTDGNFWLISNSQQSTKARNPLTWNQFLITRCVDFLHTSYGQESSQNPRLLNIVSCAQGNSPPIQSILMNDWIKS